MEYLESHPEIERFVIIDDGFRKEFDELFPEQFVRTWFRLEADNEQRARQILSGLPAQPNRECPPPIGPVPPRLFGGLQQRRYADKYRAAGAPIHLIGVEFSRASRNITAFETAGA